MTLKTRLTLGSVLLATLIAGAISAVDLANVMHLDFDATLDRAQLMKNVAAELVREALNRQRSVPLRDALRDPELSGALVNILTASRILEVAVVDLGGEILADSDQGRAVSIAFLASAVAFRKLGQIGCMLDLAASGDFEAGPSGPVGADELSIVASKVSLLGQRLRGAQFEVSDLRGVI